VPVDDGPVSDRYLLGNDQPEAGERFGALSQLFNPTTFRLLSRLGLAAGWYAWEVGAGGRSVPDWLAAQVGPTGWVLATDLDTSWLPAGAGFDVRTHDLGLDPAPDETFDLIHARLVLVHVTRREQAIADLVRCLRPGGWLVLEEADPQLQPLLCLEERDEAERLANRLKRGFRTLLSGRGVDLAFGRSLPRLLRAQGLTEVAAEGFFPVTGPACAELERATTEQIRDQLVGAGLATEDDIAQHLSNVASGRLDLATSPMISAWGRKPP
jgi:SAM-dependent methyltransferase